MLKGEVITNPGAVSRLRGGRREPAEHTLRSFDFGSFRAYAQDERVWRKFPSSVRPERRCIAPKSKDKWKMGAKINADLSSLPTSPPQGGGIFAITIPNNLCVSLAQQRVRGAHDPL